MRSPSSTINPAPWSANAMTELGLSARAYDKIRRVSRTIADLENNDAIQPQHVAEAIGYRLLDRRM
ncbi:MAG: hypothetical protein V9E83_03605 [Baekduia sp.]